MATVWPRWRSRGDARPLAVLADALVGGVSRRASSPWTSAHVQRAELVPIAGRLADAMRRGKVDKRLFAFALGQMMLWARWPRGSRARSPRRPSPPRRTPCVRACRRGAAAGLADARGCRVATIVCTGQPRRSSREPLLRVLLLGSGALDPWRAPGSTGGCRPGRYGAGSCAAHPPRLPGSLARKAAWTPRSAPHHRGRSPSWCRRRGLGPRTTRPDSSPHPTGRGPTSLANFSVGVAPSRRDAAPGCGVWVIRLDG